MTPLAALAALSGMGAMAAEVLYFRRLTVALGDMFYVHVSLLAAYFSAMAAGSLSARRLERGLPILELLAGLYALSMPLWLAAYEASPLSRLAADPRLQAALSCAALLVLPAFCMGASIPLYSQRLAERKIAGPFARVYAWYNLGAAVSVLATEFLLLPALGIRLSLSLAGGANLACGATLLFLRDRSRRPDPAPKRAPARGLAALALAGLSGAMLAGFSLKVCYHLLLPLRENFALCTAAALLCTAAGSALARRRRPGLSTCLALALLATAAVWSGFPLWSGAYLSLNAALLSPAAVLVLKIAAATLANLPSVFLGAALPALAGNSDESAGAALGVSALANAAGAALFVLAVHPLLPLWSIPALCGLLLAAALAAAGGAARFLPSLAVAGFLLAAAAGRDEGRVYAMNMPTEPDASMIHSKSFADNATLIKNRRTSMITYNGDPSIGIEQDGKLNIAEISVGVLPALLAPSTAQALVLGMGTGLTAGAAASLFDRTDAVEINQAFFPLLKGELRRTSFDLAGNPRARMINDDARRFLARPGPSYDAIINTLAGPGYYSAGKLYTAEFLDLAKSRLAPGGVYAAWVSYGETSNAGLMTMLATLRSRFRHCALYALKDSYYLLAASDRPLRARPAASPAMPARLRREVGKVADYAGLDEYYRASLLNPDVFASPAGQGVPLNTDDYPALEFQVRSRPNTLLRRDELVADPERFGVELPRTSEGLASSAVVLSRVYNLLFQRRVWPLLIADARALRLYAGRMASYYETRQAPAEDLFQMALLGQAAGDRAMALRFARRAAQADPLHARAAILLSRLYDAAGNKRESGYWRLKALSLRGA